MKENVTLSGSRDSDSCLMFLKHKSVFINLVLHAQPIEKQK